MRIMQRITCRKRIKLNIEKLKKPSHFHCEMRTGKTLQSILANTHLHSSPPMGSGDQTLLYIDCKHHSVWTSLVSVSETDNKHFLRKESYPDTF